MKYLNGYFFVVYDMLSKKSKIAVFFILMGILFCIAPLDLLAQSKGNKFFFGGNMGAQFGSITYIEASPFVGYKVTERLSAGTGITYIYFRQKNIDFETSIYGGRLFSRYLVTENIFAHIEYEVLSREIIDFNFNRRRIEIGSFLVGGGYRQPLGENASVQVSALWNLNQTVYSPYVNPLIRVGFAMGF